ncbi:hypothetical protein ZOD2009_17453 [Haladaptatus paucihalophilus DX253]|uniref:Uncharacterized protein n=1 Tax=Haladaptatus paucihalophilus DX253 TaxID=797209 RepID=E7QXF2_HALPU|nr:hypothetical protein [Haladaptatus paucihalophilus]EFW90955.1 hypothetical protein ZOD2009_17453 [Haladaptatus paucihalophilus DX253]SHK27335.1 hypothetical protein SAMN05444342_1169 [Haladaptatus paucihalophilus DX253]
MNTFVEVAGPVAEFVLEADGHTLGATETGSTLRSVEWGAMPRAVFGYSNGRYL